MRGLSNEGKRVKKSGEMEKGRKGEEEGEYNDRFYRFKVQISRRYFIRLKYSRDYFSIA